MPPHHLLPEESQLVNKLVYPLHAELVHFLADLTAVEAGSPEGQAWILEEVGRILGATATTLYLSDMRAEQHLVKTAKDSGGRWTSQTVSSAEEELVITALQSGQLITERRADGSIQYRLPLVEDGVSLGVLGLQTEKDFQEPEILELLGGVIARKIFQSRNAQQAQDTIEALQTFKEQLLNSRNTLRALFDSSPSSIYIVDPAYKLIAINMNRSEMAGRSPKELVGKQCFSALYKRESPCQGCLVENTLHSGVNTRRIESRKTSTEEMIELEISTFPIWDEEKHIIQAFLFEEDVTERQQLQASLAQSEKLAAVGQLAAGVAHEINNPLTAILANAQLLQRKVSNQDEELQEMVDLIIQASDRASQAVRDLLDFARRERYELTAIDVNETIQRTISLMGHELSSRSIALKFDPDPELPKLLASEDHLQGVWLNLLINAIDAIDPGPGKIEITTALEGDKAVVAVRDDGVGISPEYIARIFEPFYTTKDPGRGTGLGLSVCHQIITQHGGQIQVSSQPGEGTTFRVFLPLS